MMAYEKIEKEKKKKVSGNTCRCTSPAQTTDYTSFGTSKQFHAM